MLCASFDCLENVGSVNKLFLTRPIPVNPGIQEDNCLMLAFLLCRKEDVRATEKDRVCEYFFFVNFT